ESSLSAVAVVSPNDVWAVGYTTSETPDGHDDVTNALIERWDGSAWSMVPTEPVTDTQTNLWGIAAVARDDVWAVGDFDVAADTSKTLILHWNGSKWSIVPSPNAGLAPRGDHLGAIAVISANDIWTVGASTANSDTGDQRTLIEHWDGTQW